MKRDHDGEESGVDGGILRGDDLRGGVADSDGQPCNDPDDEHDLIF